MTPAPARRYDRAWLVRGEEQTGVLVALGNRAYPYWWLLCPADATLYWTTVSLIEAQDDPSCRSLGCEFPDVHRAASVLAEWLRRNGHVA